MSGYPIELCLVTQHFHPAYSGAAQRFRRYAPGLLDRGVRTSVFAAASEAPADQLGNPPMLDRSSKLLPPETVDGIPVQRVRLPRGSPGAQARQFMRSFVAYWMGLGEKPHVVQLLSLSVSMLPVLPSLRRVRTPVVHTHTMVSKMSSVPLKRWLQRVYWPLPFRVLDRIVVNSSVMKDSLLAMGVSVRVEVIQNGVDLKRFRPVASTDERDSLRRKLKLPENCRIVLFVGRISARKGVDVLVEAWARVTASLPDAVLVLVGPGLNERNRGEAGFGARLQERLMQAGAARNVMFTGAVDNVHEYFRAADAFVFPSRREGMPNAVLEAFASGLPTILTPFIGLPSEFGSPEKEYLLSEGTPLALSVAIDNVLSDAPQAWALGRRARQWAEETMSVDTSLDLYADLYRELASSVERDTLNRR